MRRLSVIVALLIAFLPARSIFAQVKSLSTETSSVFGESITFQARVTSLTPVKVAAIFYQAEGDTRTNVGLGRVTDIGRDQYRLDFTHAMSDYTIRPFSTIHLHWELTMADGDTFTSPDESGYYGDTRFQWQTLEEGSFRVHWYEGGLQFGQDILNTAKEGADRINDLLPMPEPQLLDIYVYADSESMQAALRPGSDDWIAGHADPDLGVILVALPDVPEQKLLAQQRIPHELMHILMYQNNKLGYNHIPAWLKEGLASQAELYPNQDYKILLDDAISRESLIPISALCYAFPREASSALLSYAEAQSFIQYLHDTYGASGLQSLITSYANGLDCENGARLGLGKSLTQIENNWQRDALSQDVNLKAFLNLLPWMILFLAVLGAPLLIALLRIRPN